MKKEKKTEEIQVNPADYDYMDEMPLDGWMWEFIRRGEKYELIFQKFERLKNKFPDLFAGDINTIETPVRVYNLLRDLDTDIGLRVNFIPIEVLSKFSSNNFLIFQWADVEGAKMCMGIPNPDVRYKDFPEIMQNDKLVKINPQINFSYDVRATLIDKEIIDQHEEWFDRQLISTEENEHDHNFNKHCADIIGKLSPRDFRNTLFLGIPMVNKIEDIEKEVHKILQEYINKSPFRRRPEKWKFPLIIHDLKNNYPHLIYAHIAQNLIDAYPDFEIQWKGKIRTAHDYFDEKKCENAYKLAVALINGDYKKYI